MYEPTVGEVGMINSGEMKMEDEKFRQDETDNLQKSVNPNADYMRDHDLCRVCHGKVQVCDRSDCPQK